MQLWVDKYAPTKLEDLVGNPSNIETLKNWLVEWDEKYRTKSLVTGTGTGKKVKKNTEEKRAAIITGPPGIGKTTVATIICEICGYQALSLNASDARSKKVLQEKIGVLLGNSTIESFFGKKKQNICIIMDEVDGMSSGDRGGMVEIKNMIMTTHVPIICIANERKQNMKTLIDTCLDLKFTRPTPQQIKKRIKFICQTEVLKIDDNAIEEMVSSAKNDIRSIINNLQYIAGTTTNIRYLDAKKENLSKGSMQLTVFDIIKDVFEYPVKPLEKMMNLHFSDPLVPLFVQENYVNIRPSSSKSPEERLEKICKAADCISLADLIDKRIKSTQEWQLAPVHGDLATILPAAYMRGSYEKVRNFDRYYGFPACLGKQSTTTKVREMYKSIRQSSKLHSGNNADLLTSVPLLKDQITLPLVAKEAEGIVEATKLMVEYGISKDIFDDLQPLQKFYANNSTKDFSTVPTKVKTAFTRYYNQHHSKITNSKKKETCGRRRCQRGWCR